MFSPIDTHAKKTLGNGLRSLEISTARACDSVRISRPADGFVGLVDGLESIGHMIVIVSDAHQHAPRVAVPILVGYHPQLFSVHAIAICGVEFFTHQPTP